ncbi:MAG TPA: MMPL family transporter [Pirellulaceae bacterium]|nr:MMPL family transporter [Pirellulaceae bacterium]
MAAERMPPDESLLAQPLAWLTEWTLRSPGALLWCVGISALVAIVITLNGLQFKTSRLDLLNPESRYNQRWLAYLEEFGHRDDAVIVVRADDPAAVRAAIDDVAEEVSAHPQLFESVLWRRDLSRLKSKGLHLLPPAELARIAASLRPAVQAKENASPASVLARLNAQLERSPNLPAEQRELLERQYAQVAGLLLAATSGPDGSAVAQAGLQRPADPAAAESIPRLLAGLAHLDPQYLTADEGRMGFVLLKLTPEQGGFARGGASIGKLRKIIEKVASRKPAAWLGLTGMPVIEYDEMRISQWDMLWTNVVSLVGCVLLFVAGYGGIRHAAMATAVLLVGMAWSFAFVTLAVGHLNILSSAFAIVLIGLGIDFGIHYAASYLKLRGLGVEPRTALVRTAREVGPGVVTSGVTTAAAFLMAGMTQFVGVRELGIIAGGGILLCVISAIVVLPPLILVFDRERTVTKVPTLLPVALWLSWLHTRPGLVLSLAVIGTAASLVGVTRLTYDHNLLHLQPSHVESVQIEEQIFAEQEDSVWFAVSMCDSRKELRRRKALFNKLPGVAKTEEIASLIPDPNRQRQQAVAEIHQSLVNLLEDPRTPESKAMSNIRGLKQELSRGAALLSADLPYESPAAQALAQMAERLTHVPPPIAAATLEALSAQTQVQLRRSIQPLTPLLALSDPSPPTTGDLPRELADRYIGQTGKHLLKVYAKGDVWDMDRLRRFVAEVESVDPQATGHPVQTYYASRHLQISYIQAGVFALLAVFSLLLFDFRSIRHALLAMVPLGMGFLQMCGLIGWFGIPLNAANLIALPLILGIGVDDGVHLVHELRRSGGRFRLTDSTAVAVILISTTTMASFGALILARHQGLRSLGQVLTLGTFLCLTCSMVAFPAFLTWLTRKLPIVDEDEQETEAMEEAARDVDPPVEAAEPVAAKTPVVLPEPSWMSVESLREPETIRECDDPLAPPRGIVPRRRAG